MDFEVEGAGVWRGGYNSGKINSTNNLYLDIECGINRVSVRTTRTPGPIIVRARCEGLKPASVTIESKPVEVTNGFTASLPVLPTVPLPKVPPARTGFRGPQRPTVPKGQVQPQVGRFVKAFSYSGPTGPPRRVERNAQDGKNVYVDRDCPIAGLPAELKGADWVQAAQGDSLYNAVDLMELAVTAGAVISVAHDDRLARTAWLTRQFKPTNLSIAVNGQPMSIFQRRIDLAESLTLGANTEDGTVKAANMYIVFVNAAPTGR